MNPLPETHYQTDAKIDNRTFNCNWCSWLTM